MGVELLRIAAEQGLLVSRRPGLRTVCPRCAGWLELPERPPGDGWWLRRVCAFATRHRHLRGPVAP